MINRNDIIIEQVLRENIRKAISIVKNKRLKEEKYIRNIIRSLLSEATTFKYEYFSLNQLAHFINEKVGSLQNTSGKFPFKEDYTDLSSNHEDRETYLEYIIDFAEEDFKIIDADKEPTPLSQAFVDKGFVYDEEEESDEEEEDKMIKLSIEDLEDSGGDISRQPEEESEEEDIFSIGEDGEIIENDEDDGLQRFSRESYKKIGADLRRYYGLVKKNDVIKKPVIIDNKEYAAGELSERELFKIYFKKNLILWAERYEDEFFSDHPETQVDIEAEDDNLPDNGQTNDENTPEDEMAALDALLE